MKKIFLLFTFAFVAMSFVVAQNKWTPVFMSDSDYWADSIMKTLTLDEKIGQLFMVSAYSNKDENHTQAITQLIKNYKIGGIMFLQGSPTKQANLTNYYQSVSKIPLMIALDAEWGPAMRLDSVVPFPWQMTLGAIQDETLLYEMGKQIALQCKMLGVNINFAPVADINSNPKNPIIGNRSFGEDKDQVAKLAAAYMKGMQDNGVLACAKHFPGHGDTDTDSHKTLPVIRQSKYQLAKTEMVPFQHLIVNGLGSMMVAHIRIPSIDVTENLAASLSKNVVSDILQNELGFQGLVFTDALNMKGVSEHFISGELELRALLAGNDVLLMSEDVPTAIKKIKEAIASKEITLEEIDQKCRKILRAKQWMKLQNYNKLSLHGLVENINNSNFELTNRKLVENSITLLQNYDQLIPLQRLDTLKIASISIGEDATEFQNMLSNYAAVTHFSISGTLDAESSKKWLNKLKSYNLVIASIHSSNANPWKKYKLERETDLFLQTLAVQSKVLVVLFTNPYTINNFLFTNNFDGFLMGYQNSTMAQQITAQSIFGGIGIKGKLPVSTNHFPMHTGKDTKPFRMKYTIPKEVGMNEKILLKIDSLAKNAIQKGATPGCQILVAKQGKVFFQKSYGYHTYEKKVAVKNTDLYDLASVTKIAATLPMLMHMQEEGNFGLGYKLGKFDESFYKTEVGFLRTKDILAHQAGLKAWIPFYKKTLNKDKSLKDTLYSTVQSKKYPVKVADNLYLHKSYPDSIIQQILTSDISDNHSYLYSDLGFYLFKAIIEKHYNAPLNELVDKQFYKPLGLTTMGYLPKTRFDKSNIVPTEQDNSFRNQLLVGDVHDQGAAMLGGVAGHAGLFSNANDLAILMQMYLQKGVYADRVYLQESTIDQYTECQFCIDGNRRGAGFDKPVFSNQKGGPTCQCVSPLSFGHTGFTGTMVWADPETEIIFVFLSNRIHPDAENRKLQDMDVRTNIMQVIYDANQQ